MAITFALHAFHTHTRYTHTHTHTHIHTHSLIHLHIISGRRQSMQIRMVHRCVLRISIQSQTDLSPKGLRQRLIDSDRLETLPWVRSHLGRIIIQGPSSTNRLYSFQTWMETWWPRVDYICSTHTYTYLGNTQLTNVCLKIIFSMGKLETRRSSKFN